jgi:integrase
MITISHSDTLSEFLRIWMDVHVRPRLAPKTAERYGSLTAHVSRAIGDTALENVNAFLLEQLYAALRLRLSARSVRHVHECIHSALAAAVRWDMLPTNPVGRCRLPPADRPEARAIGFAETGDLIAATAASWVGPAVQLAAATGARRTPRAPLVGLRCTSRRREDPGSDQLCRFGTNPEVNQEPAITNRTLA